MNLSTASGRQTWWNYLEPQWQQAFNEAVLNKRGMPTTAPSDENLKLILESKVLRLAGPTAPYPNVSIEVNNCSGLEALKDLEILVITHAKLTDLKMMKNFPNLVSIFVNNNQITTTTRQIRANTHAVVHPSTGRVPPTTGLGIR